MKRKIGVWIPHEEVWDEFIELVKAKWGKKHSVLGMELEEAIKAYIKKERDNMEFIQEISAIESSKNNKSQEEENPLPNRVCH